MASCEDTLVNVALSCEPSVLTTVMMATYRNAGRDQAVFDCSGAGFVIRKTLHQIGHQFSPDLPSRCRERSARCSTSES